MDITINPSKIRGTVEAVPSKSHAHRLLICAALADAPTRIVINRVSNDINATARCLRAMGAVIDEDDGVFTVKPINRNRLPVPCCYLDCGESGATARFLLPLAASLFKNFTLTGEGRLPDRPFNPLCSALAGAGCTFDGDRLPLSGKGTLKSGDFYIAGDVSSQFISGLLFALPLLDGDSRINITTALESVSYVEITIGALNQFGIEIERTSDGYFIRGDQNYTSCMEAHAEGDWSNAAFFFCMGALNGTITVNGLSTSSMQGDREVLNILSRFGARVDGFNVSKGTLRGIEIDAAQIPDLVPALAVAAAAAEGETRIFNAGRLRIKESDRLQSVRDMLVNLGANAVITKDGLIIRGKSKLTGGVVDGVNDHRIVMAAATAAFVCDKPVTIKGCEAVNKSYPSFFNDLEKVSDD